MRIIEITHGDNEFRGLGRIRCAVCGEALAIHPIRPCAMLGEELITTISRSELRKERAWKCHAKKKHDG